MPDDFGSDLGRRLLGPHFLLFLHLFVAGARRCYVKPLPAADLVNDAGSQPDHVRGIERLRPFLLIGSGQEDKGIDTVRLVSVEEQRYAFDTNRAAEGKKSKNSFVRSALTAATVCA